MITRFDVVARVAVSVLFLGASWRTHSVWPALTAAIFAFNAGMCFSHLRTRRR